MCKSNSLIIVVISASTLIMNHHILIFLKILFESLNIIKVLVYYLLQRKTAENLNKSVKIPCHRQNFLDIHNRVQMILIK